MKPLISIIVPIYNVPEQYLRRSIESCVNQTVKDVEIILVDDGSPDDCGKICDEYAAKDERICVIHKKNGGLVSARNAGYDAVKGDWHMYLDGDDWIDLNTCEDLLEKINNHPDIDVVFWNCIQELGEKSIRGKFEWKCGEKEKIYTGDDCKDLSRNVLIYKSGIATAYSKLIRTSYARIYNIRHDDRLKQGLEGTEFSLRTFYYASRVLFLKEYYNHYLYNPNSISKRIDEKNTQYALDCLKVMSEDVSAFYGHDAFTKALYQRTVYALIAFAMNTYFHPNNPDGLMVASRKFAKVIKENNICRIAISETPLSEMDKQRMIVLLLFKMKMYPLLKPIAVIKQKLLKRGYYNY